MKQVEERRFICKFVTSDWALAEMIQSFRSRAIIHSFLLDGNELSAFNRFKAHYKVQERKRRSIHQAIMDFQTFLHKNHVQTVKINIDVHKIHEYCLKYSLDTPDATHLQAALQQSCNYMVTVDRPLIEADVKEIQIIDPGTLFRTAELRQY